MAQWFGASWGAPVCEPETHVPTPVGERCAGCGGSILAHDDGFVLPFIHGACMDEIYYHRGCLLREILGPGWAEVHYV